MGADAAQCAKYSKSPTKSDQHLFPPSSDEGGLPIDRRKTSPSGPSPKGSPAQRRKNGATGAKSGTKGKKKSGDTIKVPGTNGLSPPSPKGQSPNVRRKTRPKSAPKRSPDHHHSKSPIVLDDYATPDDYQLDEYSEEEIKLPDDAYDEDYEEDDEGRSSESGGSLSPARVMVNGKGDHNASKLSPSHARRHKGGHSKARRKKRKDDTKVTWHE